MLIKSQAAQTKKIHEFKENTRPIPQKGGFNKDSHAPLIVKF